jgi:anaerobic selenocysteine-containing dehydrogenase
MKRRTFLQLTGATAAGAVVAGCQSGNEKLIPFLVPPDEGVTPGLATYYASACRACPAGCGILIRVADGRARKIEGNPHHPVNQGKLCARGQAALQELYHPDRVRQPLKRSGPRGSGEFVPVTWAAALDLLTAELKTLQQAGTGDRLALLTPPLRGTLAELTARFMGAFGSPHHLAYELLGPDWLRAATRRNFGQPSLPYYDLAETRYLLSFGAEFIDHHLSPVHYGAAFGRMRQGRNTVRGHFTFVGGRLSLTGASADRWLPARPGSEGALALGMARLILEESRHDATALAAAGLTRETLLAELADWELPQVAEATGLTAEAIAEVAREFAATPPAVAMVGEAVAWQSNGAESVAAVQLLNLLAGALNRPGGVYPDGTAPEGPEDSFADLTALVAAMNQDRIRVALIQGDPVHAIPPATGFQDALARVPFIVSCSSLLNDTALQSDLVLPEPSALESWGDVIPLAGARTAVTGLLQPVVAALYETRAFPDLLLTLARQLGGPLAAALPQESYRELLQAALRPADADPGENAERAWVEMLALGGRFQETPDSGAGYRWAQGGGLPRPAPARFIGAAAEFPLHLQVDPSTALYDGRGASLPWLQQLPDPMTTVVWGSWVELNPVTAAKLGVAFGDLVEVASPRGSLTLPVVIYPGIRPDLVAIPLGQGHQGGGRYARGRGVNPLALLCLDPAAEVAVPAWQGTRVRVTRRAEGGGMVTAGHPEGSYRHDLVGI